MHDASTRVAVNMLKPASPTHQALPRTPTSRTKVTGRPEWNIRPTRTVRTVAKEHQELGQPGSEAELKRGKLVSLLLVKSKLLWNYQDTSAS